MSPPRGGGDKEVVEQQCKRIFDIDFLAESQFNIVCW